jgi:diacylglycerol O-acyltransferase 2, plant
VIYPEQKVYGLAASAVFYLPGYKHFMRWVGCMPASRDNLVQLLKKGSVAVTMGGIAEMCAPLPGLTPDAA